MKKINVLLFDEAVKVLEEMQKEERLKNDEAVNKIILEYGKTKKKEEKKK